jgi:hypothetical protein
VALYKGTISFERTAVRTPKNIIPMDSTEKITMRKSAYVIAGGYDAAIRIGEVIEQDMVAIRLGADLRSQGGVERPRPAQPFPNL